jgi:flagellar protein FlbT
MALKVELKPGEKMILGECVITNDDQRTRLYIQGNVPILREKDILTPETADTPAKKVYLAVQMMYLDRDPQIHHETYFNLTKELMAAAPSMLPLVEKVNNKILTGSLYKALKEAKALIAYEGELIGNASRSTGLRKDSAGNG